MRLENAEIRIYKAIVDEGGFARAAERLHISQSAVSQSFKNLEAKVDAPLFASRNPLSLNDAGRRLYQYAEAQQRAETAAWEDLEQIKIGSLHQLSLGVNSAINKFHAPGLLIKYCSSHPRSGIKIEELPSRSIIYAVLSGQLELGMGPFQTHMQAFETIPLFTEHRHLVISPNHPFYADIKSASKKTSTNAMRKVPLITSYVDDPDLRPSMEKIRHNFAKLWEISSLSLRLKMLSQGLGVAYVSEQVLKHDAYGRGLETLDVSALPKIKRIVGLYHQKDRSLSSAAQAFIELCRNHWSLSLSVVADNSNDADSNDL